jgi:hypothetical protein
MENIDLKHFMDSGLLQECNRLFFHPRGMALIVGIDDEDNYSLRGIADSTEDPEGFLFTEISEEKKKYAKKLYDSKSKVRTKKVGAPIQEKGLDT